jgi:hypothetical protein
MVIWNAARRASALGVMLFWLGIGGAGAQTYGQPYPAPYGQSQPPSSQWGFRPVPPTNAQGVPPHDQPPPAPNQIPGQMRYPPPGWSPGYPVNQAQPLPATPPRLEWSLDENQPYLQQPVILRLDLISNGNLTTVNLELPATDDVLIKQLVEPKTSARTTSGQREIVTAFVLSVVPLRAGNLDLPPLRITGTQLGRGGMAQRFESVTARAIALRVRPPMNSVQPWLPLKSLTLKSSLDREGTLEPGQPVTLALEIAAAGATDAQLPSLEGQLTGPDFRIYREQTLTEGGLSPEGRELTARRTEYYTLVPQTGGRLNLPEMSIQWWNVDLGVREVTRLPIKTLDVRGGGPLGLSASALSGSEIGIYWLPLAGLPLLLAGYWIGVFYREPVRHSGGIVMSSPFHRSRLVLSRALARVICALARLNPAPMLAKARVTWSRRLPQSSHFRACLRHANRASTPSEWRERFEQEARVRLSPAGELTPSFLRQRIFALIPGADRETLTRLIAQLDAALYGRQTLDFPRWKRHFMSQVRRGSGLPRRTDDRRRVRWAILPELNPG